MALAVRTKSRREFGIDLVRVLAMVGVLLVHVSTDGYQNPVGSPDWWGSILWGTIFRRNVPLFLMCSGAILLQPGRPLPLKKLYLHNILRVLVSLLVWALIYKIYHMLDEHWFSLPNLWQACKEVLLFKHEWHLYYLQILLLVYAWLPVTRILTERGSQRELQYALAVWFAFGILYPTLKPFWPFNLLYGIPGQWLLNMTYAAIGYGLLGYYLRTYPLSRRVSLLLAVFGAGFMILGTYWMSLREGYTYTGFLEGMGVGEALLGSGVFGLCLSIRKEPRPIWAKSAAWLSRASLCIYIVHAYFLERFPSVLELTGWPTVLSVPVIALANLACCCAIYAVLSRIPVIKKWLV